MLSRIGPGGKGGQVKVRIDSEVCTGHGRCYALAPGIFDCDDAGYGEVIGDGELAAEQVELAQKAVANCPEGAIRIEES